MIARLLALLAAAIVAVWGAALFALGWASGAIVTVALFSAAAIVAGYRRGRS